MEKLVSGEQVLIQASSKVNRYNMTEIEMNTYEAELKSLRDGKAILEGSFNLGKAEERLEIAKNLKLAGLPLEMICKVTKLSAEDIANLSF